MLEYKSKNIRKIEREEKMSFFEMLKLLDSGDGHYMLLRASGMTEDEADNYIDKVGLDEAGINIYEALGEAGFLPQRVRIKMKAQVPLLKEQLKKELEEAEKAVEKEMAKLSKKSGKKTK